MKKGFINKNAILIIGIVLVGASFFVHDYSMQPLVVGAVLIGVGLLK